MNKITIVLGANTKPERYSNRAVRLLQKHDIQVIPVGIREGMINGINIQTELPEDPNIHTLSLYISAEKQKDYYDKIDSLNLKRVIFNPGTENPAWAENLRSKKIEVVENCTLVMLNSGSF